MIEFNPKSHFLLIVGMKAEGKTHLTKRFCRQIQKFIFIDPRFQATELGYCVHFPDRILPAFIRWHKVIYQPAKNTETVENYILAFKECLKIGNYCLIVDEIDEYANSYGYMCDEVREIIRRGRLQGIGLIANTRRPHLIHKDIRANADHVISFKMTEDDDLKYMSKWYGCSKGEIRQLGKHHSLYLNASDMTVTHLAPID